VTLITQDKIFMLMLALPKQKPNRINFFVPDLS